MKFSCKLNSLFPAFSALSWFVASMFVSNDRQDYTFIWLALFLSIAPMSLLLTGGRYSELGATLRSRISLRSFELLNSKLFILISFYVVLISLRTVSLESFSKESFYTNFFAELMPLAAYIIVINRLSVDIKNFTNLFIGVIILFVTMNALTNIIHYLTTINSVGDFLIQRLGGDLIGVSAGRVATNYGFTYALYAIAALIIGWETSFVPGRIFYLSYFLIIFCALLLTQGRGSILAFFLTALGYIYSQMRRKFNQYFFVIIGSLLCLFVVTVGCLWWSARLGDDGVRFAVWQQAMGLIISNPFFGYGENDIYQPIRVLPDATLYHGHNILLNAALRGGILAFVALSCFIVMGLKKTFLMKKELSESLPFFWLVLFIIAGTFDFDIVLRAKGWDWVTIWPLIGVVVGADSKISGYCNSSSAERDVV